ncbi:MAG: four helix bundle protein [Desulfatirhabdiaceae bacterium]
MAAIGNLSVNGQSFSSSEIYGLSSQFRRASVSIAANIAEGFKSV